MIFVGDISIPSTVQPNVIGLPSAFGEQAVIGNLEGAILEGNPQEALSKSVVFNSPSVIEFLSETNIKAVSLANNHITDIDNAISSTRKFLNNHDIQCSGAGMNSSEAAEEMVVEEDGTKFVLIGFGWDVIDCKYADGGNQGVNPLELDAVLDQIIKARQKYPEGKIVILPHWDYELELYPMPMHIELAHTMLDRGADAIIGHHPHCVQGYEIYNGKPIVYSLGNWFFSSGVYMNGRLKFPDFANRELAVEWKNGEIICHWFEFHPKEQTLEFKYSELSEKSNALKELSPFSTMNKKEYIHWFKKNRLGKTLLPIFKSCNTEFSNSCKKKWIRTRAKMISFLWETGIKRKRSGVD